MNVVFGGARGGACMRGQAPSNSPSAGTWHMAHNGGNPVVVRIPPHPIPAVEIAARHRWRHLFLAHSATPNGGTSPLRTTPFYAQGSGVVGRHPPARGSQKAPRRQSPNLPSLRHRQGKGRWELALTSTLSPVCLLASPSRQLQIPRTSRLRSASQTTPPRSR